MQAYKLVGQTLRTFTITRVIGKGAWAFVFEAVNTLNKNIVALKAIPVYLLAKHSKLKELIDTEINVLKQCHNENVIGYVDDFRTEDYIFIATEYCNGGDLENYLKAHGRLSEDEATTFLKQMINGFKGLHEVNAMHRDFKSANVLLHNGICKIADLGFAKQLLNKTGITHTVLGTSLTMAPEIL